MREKLSLLFFRLPQKRFLDAFFGGASENGLKKL
jgi:hypothetical protein